MPVIQARKKAGKDYEQTYLSTQIYKDDYFLLIKSNVYVVDWSRNIPELVSDLLQGTKEDLSKGNIEDFFLPVSLFHKVLFKQEVLYIRVEYFNSYIQSNRFKEVNAEAK